MKERSVGALLPLQQNSFCQGRVVAAGRGVASPLCCLIAACLVASPVGAEDRHAPALPPPPQAVASEQQAAGPDGSVGSVADRLDEVEMAVARMKSEMEDFEDSLSELRGQLKHELKSELLFDLTVIFLTIIGLVIAAVGVTVAFHGRGKVVAPPGAGP